MNAERDPLAKYRARIDAIKSQIERDQAEADAAALNAAAASAVGEHKGGRLRSLAVLAGVVLLSLSFLGAGITLINMSGHDFDDAPTAGWATVRHCDERGPVTNRGFGYWDRCWVKVRWDDGRTYTVLVKGMFEVDHVGQEVRISYLGGHADDMNLARDDTPP